MSAISSDRWEMSASSRGTRGGSRSANVFARSRPMPDGEDRTGPVPPSIPRALWINSAIEGTAPSVRAALFDPELHQLDGDDLAITLAEDAVVRAVLWKRPAALPHHDKIAGQIRGHSWRQLVKGGERVHAELRAERCAGARVSLTEDIIPGGDL